MTRRRALAVVLAVIAIVSLAHTPVSRFVRAGRLLTSLAHPASAEPALVETDLLLPGRDGEIRARLYQRRDVARGPGLVVAHGVHYRGIDERRLVPFARALAQAGRTVLTPELRDLTDYRITRQGERVLVDAVDWLSRSEHVTLPRVGLLGFSFAGGLALVAASQPELRGELEYVTSVGGHHDLARVLSFLVDNRIEAPDGPRELTAHDYGLIVVVYDNLERFVDPVDRPVVADTFRHWLHEERNMALARAAEVLTASGERVVQQLVSGRLGELAPQLKTLLEERRRELGELSPSGKLSAIGVPVYLLHGARDSVIPASEAEWADRELGGLPHSALVSPLLEHVEVDERGRLSDELALVELFSRML